MSNFTRLEIFPHRDSLEWTRLRELVGTTITVQDLPEVLKRKLLPFVRTLSESGIEQFTYSEQLAPAVWVDTQKTDISRYARNPPHIMEMIELTVWWMGYRRVRDMCKPKSFTRNGHTTWHCPDCERVVAHDKELCDDPQCFSWDKLFSCTGKDQFRPVVIRGGKTAS